MNRRHIVAPLLAALLFSCGDDDGEPPSEGDGTPEIRQLVLETAPLEDGGGATFGPPPPTISDMLRRLRAVERDEDAKGVLLQLGPMGGAWGRGVELVQALDRVREAGKPVHCHFTIADNLSFAVMARACDRISMTPAGQLELVGLAAHLFFLKTLLGHLGLEAELIQIGRFKGVAEMFTEVGPTEEMREDIGQLLDDYYEFIVSSIAEGRGDLSVERVREVVDEGPYDAWSAYQLGLVDDVGFDDEAMEHARVAGDAERVRRIRIVPPPEQVGLGEILGALAGETPRSVPEGDRIGLVYLTGSITDGEQGGGDGEGSRAGPFTRAMRSFARDEEIKALVVRIDSPGGSALASDRMWHAMRRVALKKPVIVSIGDTCASGGYYIASAATHIMAEETSLVGSIGVVGGKVNAAELADTIGLDVEVMTRGAHAAYSSPTRPFTDEERALLRRQMQQTYTRFLRRIETGRGMEREAIEPHAEGRVMVGSRALEAGLVDELGGLWDALARARAEGGLDDDAPIERWPPERTFLDAIAQGMAGETPGERSRTLVRDAAAAAGLGHVADLAPLFMGRERVVLTMPYVLHIE
jgi:protease-4